MHSVEEVQELANWLYENRRKIRPPMSKERLASFVGVHKNTYERMEEGRSIPDWFQIKKLVDEMGWPKPPGWK